MAVNHLGTTKEEMWEQMQKTIDLMANGWEEGLCNRLQLRVEEVDPDNMSYVCSFATERWMASRGTFVHGGMISTMMDQAMGYLSCATAGTITLTVNLNVSFLRSVHIDDRFFVRARVTQAGKSFVHVSGEAWVESDPGRKVSSGTAIFHGRPVVRSDGQVRNIE